jgi:hypothetical protein
MSDEDIGAHVPPERKGNKPDRFERYGFRRRNAAGFARRNPAFVLLQFRDGHATDMASLLQALGVPYPGAGQHIRDIVREMIEAGLLKADNPRDRELKRTKIRVTELFSKIQRTLNLSITFLASIDPQRSVVVDPLFGKPYLLDDKTLDVFVLMPFKAAMVPVYEDHIKPTCASLRLTVRRADDFFTADRVVEDIWSAIASARLIIADCTGRNPNVFYEIGLAHTIGKPTILLTQREEDIPFDLRHWRYISYKLTPRGMTEFETKFKETVRNVLSETAAVLSIAGIH